MRLSRALVAGLGGLLVAGVVPAPMAAVDDREPVGDAARAEQPA